MGKNVAGWLIPIWPCVLTAPGAYDPERADQCVRSLEPSYTFGVKYKDPKRDDFPGRLKAFLLASLPIPNLLIIEKLRSFCLNFHHLS